MPIKGITDIIRYQRAGKIRLGTRIKTGKTCRCVEIGVAKSDCRICLGTGIIHRPKEEDYFVLKDSPELIEFYPGEPKLLHVKLPLSYKLEQIFSQDLKRYGMDKLLCKGNGTKANCVDFEKGELVEIECPCNFLEEGKCAASAILNVRISELESSMRVYQIVTGSFNSIVNLNNAIREIIWRCYANKINISSLFLQLTREKTKTQRLTGAQVARGIHYPMFLDLDKRMYKSWDDVIKKAEPLPMTAPKIQLPAPDISEEEVLRPDNGTEAIEVEVEEVPEKEKKEQEKIIEEAKQTKLIPIEAEDEIEDSPQKVEFDKLAAKLRTALNALEYMSVKLDPKEEKMLKKKMSFIDMREVTKYFNDKLETETKKREKIAKGKKVEKKKRSPEETPSKEAPEKEETEMDKIRGKLNQLVFRLFSGYGVQTSLEDQQIIINIKTEEDGKKALKHFEEKLKEAKLKRGF